MNTKIRPAEPEDDKEIPQIIQSSFAGSPWFENLSLPEAMGRWQKARALPGFQSLVATKFEKVVGGIWWDFPSIPEITAEKGTNLAQFIEAACGAERPFIWERCIVIAPEHQGNGIATKLRSLFVAEVVKMKKQPIIFTRMRDDNTGIIRLAEKMGFRRSGIRVPSSQKKEVFHEFWLLDTTTLTSDG